MVERSEQAWWSVARSEEVTDKKPLSVDVGAQPIVLWRDQEGIARALEDRCPHRRAPLSRGCVRDNGWLQCGYHGWSYDGETGRLKEIPNMKDQQRFPPVYKAQAFSVWEDGGFVSVCLQPNAARPAGGAPLLSLGGTTHVPLHQSLWVSALLDDPGLVIAIRGVRFTPYLMSELRDIDGQLVLERNCLWAGLHWPAPFTAEFPITLLIRIDPVTAKTELTLRDGDLRTLLSATVAPVPAARGVTAVRWRAEPGAAKGIRGRALGFGRVFSVKDSIDAAALRQLLPSSSVHYEDFRLRMGAQAGETQAAA